jgi:hypothetical protein
MSSVLNSFRGRKIAFYLSNSYNISPADALAESIVPNVTIFHFPSHHDLLTSLEQLKGGDSVLYHALKVYKLSPELHWSAGGYIWPMDHTVDLRQQSEPLNRKAPRSFEFPSPDLGADGEDIFTIRSRVESSGAIPLSDTDIAIITDYGSPTAPVIGKERVSFITGGELDKLVVNTLIVVYVP